MSVYNDTYTITFGGQVENHVGMEKIGKLDEEGFSISDLEEAKIEFENQGCKCELINLKEAVDFHKFVNFHESIDFQEAAVLIIRKGADQFADSDKLYEEQSNLTWDKKAKQRGKVVNKHARWNLCYADFDQEPDYEQGKGRVVSFKNLPYLSEIRNYLHGYMGSKATDLLAEGNYYYDLTKCYIGWHGDFERRIVIAVRLGASMSLHYQWYYKNEPIGNKVDLMLNHGDMYMSSEKAVGQDWKKRNIHTLRHSAGAEKFLAFKKT